MTPQHRPIRTLQLSRRAFLGVSAGAAASFVLASCAPSGPTWVSPTGAAVQRAEEERGGTGRVVTASLVAAATTLDLAGTLAPTYSYGPVPGPVLRLGAGDTLRASIRNDMPFDTSIHWHGIALRNDMDGVPPLTQAPIAPGAEFLYDFVPPDPGTYWYHSHVGAQLDRGLYAAIIVEDPSEPLQYDDEWVVVLDDWLDGVGVDPDEVFEELRQGMPAGGMDEMFMRDGNMLMGANSDLLEGDAGDVYYPYFLVNGKPKADPEVFTTKPGNRVRIRLISAAGDTAFRVALGGHTLTVTHTDGFPIEPVEVESVLIGLGERYDVVVTLDSGVFPFIAEALGKQDHAFAIVRTGDGAPPAADVSIDELSRGRIATAADLKAAESVTLPSRTPDRQLDFRLTGDMGAYNWGIYGVQFNSEDAFGNALAMRSGERVRITMKNETMMWHPLHLHGHTYQHADGGPRKDTSIVLPGQTIIADFDADNPGQWFAHCHNVYHLEAGMGIVFAYEQ